MPYTTIAIIYNPNSTGSSESLARKLETQLRSRLPSQKIECVATQHAGHAEELAYSISRASKHPLVISSSGDGGYYEVVNGVIKAQLEGATPAAGLLPAGNANDHHRNLHDKDVITRIINEEVVTIDLLKLTGTSGGKQIERYAHSYIGFGLTPWVGKELNKTKINRLSEFWVVARSFFNVQPVALRINDRERDYDSVIFSNVDEMSKYLKISQPSKIDDGKFEITIFKSRNKFILTFTLLKAAFGLVKQNASVSDFSLEVVDDTLVQLDGEVVTLDANSAVEITINSQILSSVI